MNDRKPFNQNAYIDEYKRLHYERLYISLPKGMKEAVKNHAAARGQSLNGYVASLIERDMNGSNERSMNEKRRKRTMKKFWVCLSAATAVELEQRDNPPELPEYSGIEAENVNEARDKVAKDLERLGYRCDTIYINELELYVYDNEKREYIYWADEED